MVYTNTFFGVAHEASSAQSPRERTTQICPKGADVRHRTITALMASITEQDGARLPNARQEANKLRLADEGIQPVEQVLITEDGFENLTSYPFDERLMGQTV